MIPNDIHGNWSAARGTEVAFAKGEFPGGNVQGDDDDIVRIRTTAFTILAHFKSHLKASDTLEGIARWWVAEDERIVRSAMTSLVRN